MFLKKNKKAKKETINIKKEEKAEKVTYHKSITNKQDKKKKMIVEVPTTTSELMKCLFKDYNDTYNIFRISDDGYYSTCLEYEDISFSKAQKNEQFNIFNKWVTYLNSFSESTHIQIVNIGRPIHQENFKKHYMYDNEAENLTENEKRIAKEFNSLIEKSITSESEKQETKRYIVLSCKCESYADARDKFYDYQIKTENKFRELKSSIRQVTIEEMLEVTHDFFHAEKFIDKREKIKIYYQ